MKRKRYISNQKSNRIKRPSAVWFIVFGAVLLLFAAFIFLGIKAGEYAKRAGEETAAISYHQINTEEIL